MSELDCKGARELTLAAIDYGWDVLLRHGVDTAMDPFITVNGSFGASSFRVTWHAREFGSYRLFSCLLNKRDVSLKKLRAYIERRVSDDD